MFWWVKVKLVGENVKDSLNLDPTIPTVYILPHRSLSDLLVLYQHCRILGLPIPKDNIKAIGRGGQSSYVYLAKLGLLQPIRSELPPTPLQNLCRRMGKNPSLKVNLVPVSIIWGRNPGTEERSLFKLLFSDDEHAGLLQKLFIILAQGRDTLLHFGKPISLRDQIDQSEDPDQTARKIRRVIRVHFRTQRNIAIGPKSYDRNRLIRSLLNRKSIQDAVDADSLKTKISRKRVEGKAKRYLLEIASLQTHSIVRFFDIILGYIWQKIYNGIKTSHGARLRDTADQHEIVFVPAHRSHLDYLVLPYELYHLGLSVPHTAAGVNLSFWPVGPLLRRGGAFFLRRSFRGNRLYAAIFTEYVGYLLNKGHSIAFFPEGGRSRTGRLLSPKTGMLSMIVQSFVNQPERPVALVPVYIGYDKTAEVKSYLRELHGSVKRKESFLQLLKARDILKTQHGKAYVGFGKPISLGSYLKSYEQNWEELERDEKTRLVSRVVAPLADDLMKRINEAAMLSPIALFSLAMLSAPQRALPEKELIDYIDLLVKLVKGSSWLPEARVVEESPQEIIRQSELVMPVSRFKYPNGGDVLHLSEIEAEGASYYRNNILHLYALPSLVASFFQHNDQVDFESLVRGIADIYPFLLNEFFLKWEPDQLEDESRKIIDLFIKYNLVSYSKKEKKLFRAPVDSKEFPFLRMLGRALGLVFERYSISTAILAKNKGEQETTTRAKFESSCRLMAQRIALLNGLNDPQFYDKSLFRQYVDLLKKQGYVEETKSGELVIDSSITDLASRSNMLLSPDIWLSINRITKEQEL